MFKKLSFDYNVYLLIDDNFSVEIEADDHWQITVRSEMLDHLYSLEQKLDIGRSREIIHKIEDLCLDTWQDEYNPEGFIVCDGYTWELEYEDSEKDEVIKKRGNNAFPWCFYKLIGLLIDLDPELDRIIGKYAEPMECFYNIMEGRDFDLDERKIVEYLKDHIGEKITSYQLVKATDSYLSDDLEDADLFDLHRQIRIIAEENDFYLDMSEHDNKCEGLPYNLDFVIISRR